MTAVGSSTLRATRQRQPPAGRRPAAEPEEAAVRTEPTRSGWGVLVTAGLLCLAAGLFGMQELYALAAAALVLLAACAWWSRKRSWRLDSERSLRPARASVGDSICVRLRVRNPTWRRSPVLSVRDPLDDGRKSVSLALAPLAPGEESSAEYWLNAEARGVFGIGPLRIELSDPFGLVRSVRRGAPQSNVTVHPRVERIRPIPMSSGLHRRGAAGSPVLGGTGEDFYSVREFRTGDDVRRIHWSATARLDQVMVRQDDTPWHGRITLALDLRASQHDDSSLEAALSASASLAAAAGRTKSPVRLVTTGGADTGFGSSARHHAGILDTLASARAAGSGPLMGALGAIARGDLGGSVVALLSDAAGEEDLAALRVACRNRDLTVVMVETSGQGRRPDAGSPAMPCRSVKVPAGASFAHAWDAVIAGAGIGAGGVAGGGFAGGGFTGGGLAAPAGTSSTGSRSSTGQSRGAGR